MIHFTTINTFKSQIIAYLFVKMAKQQTYVNFHDYTYLNANGYLQKFRNALGRSYLDRATLTKLLKVFNKEHKLVRFIVPDYNGNYALYYKNTLNNILGIDETGYQHTKPSSNPYLKELDSYLERWERQEFEKEFPTTQAEEPEEDEMSRVSRELIDYDNFNEGKMARKIYITESQLNRLMCEGTYPVEPEKVKIVNEFLDSNFIRAGLPIIGEDGYPSTTPIVALKGTDGNPVRNMTDKQAFELLKDKFGKIYSEKDRVNKFLAQILKDWYYKKISKQGLLSVNSY